MVFFLFACKPKVDDPDWKSIVVDFKDSVTLTPVRHLYFPLDSATILYYETCQFEEKTNSLVSFNSTNRDLLFFNYNTGKLKWRVNLAPVGIRRKHSGNQKLYSFNVVNCDSIFFYDYESSKVVLFDTSSKIINIFDVKSDKSLFIKGIPVVGELLPVSKDSIYISSAPGRNPYSDKAPLPANLILSISLKTGFSQPIIKYPNIYKKAKWGNYLHAFHALYNEQNNKLVVSYPIDHNLNVYDSKGMWSRYYAGGKGVESINPVKFSGDNNLPVKDEEAKNFISQKTYASILFDHFRGVYYRIVSCPIPIEDFDRSRIPGYKKTQSMAIVILNSSFAKVGEVAIDANKYSTTAMFISREGLCLPLTVSNDDSLAFDVFAIKKK